MFLLHIGFMLQALQACVPASQRALAKNSGLTQGSGLRALGFEGCAISLLGPLQDRTARQVRW